ncbi:MAG: transaldolase [Synergistaceae bacterium]|jgi:transaldolase|nr:transaldolase [Synergistaceae bacterium]
MPKTDSLKIKIFMDGADIESIRKSAEKFPFVKGFTTNPTLMRKSGVKNYKDFALQAINYSEGSPISFEVFSDEFEEMERQSRIISSWGENVFVKIPITNTKGESSSGLIERLSDGGVRLNVTAILTVEQAKIAAAALNVDVPSVVSVFAGRIADTGIDPVPMMRDCLSALSGKPRAELLWASTRELLNIVQADSIGCHIITATADVIGKLELLGRDLDEYSLDTVKMFHSDAAAAGYEL